MHEVSSAAAVALVLAYPVLGGLTFWIGRHVPAREFEVAAGPGVLAEARADGYEEGRDDERRLWEAETVAAEVPAVPAASVVVPAAYEAAGVAEGPPAVPAAIDGPAWLSDMHEQLSPARLERPDDDGEPVTGQIVALAAPVVADLGRVGDGSDRTFYRCQLQQAQWRRAMDAEIHDLDALLGLGAAA
jgi:hypothetical protein